MSVPNFTRLIRDDMRLSLGVTEPGAIALAVSRARSLTQGEIESVVVETNSGIYKNAFTCGIPGTSETGNVFAAALGVVAGDWTRGLSALEGIAAADVAAARSLIGAGKVRVVLRSISSDLYLKATVKTTTDQAEVVIEGSHSNISRIVRNGEILHENAAEAVSQAGDNPQAGSIADFALADFWKYADAVPAEEIAFVGQAHAINTALMQAGIESEKNILCKEMLADNGGVPLSENMLRSAHAMTAAAIEARVRGGALPAMSIAGSGNHGIMCTMPLKACAVALGIPGDRLLRATCLSYLVTLYIKEHSGRLSAFCGCAIAGGTGAAVGLLYLLGGTLEQAGLVIDNMASALTGVICTGGNPACVFKAAAAIDSGFKSVKMAMNNVGVGAEHGINGGTPEQTMRNMGLIASPGMVGTEGTIVGIMQGKGRGLHHSSASE